MAGLNALVTGATGFIGSHLCRALLDQGCQVRAFHRATSVQRMLDGLEVEHIIGDITQPETLLPALKGMDWVFHAAAWMGGHDQPGREYAVTVEGTRFLLQAAIQAGVTRVVYTSSAAALGVPDMVREAGQPTLLNEYHTWNLRPERYPSGYAKYLAEQEVQKAVAQGLDAVIVNPTLVFGPGDVYRQAGSLITRVAERRVNAAVEGGVNCVHVDDVAMGHIAAAKRGQMGRRYLLGGENLTHHQLLQMIAQITGVQGPSLVLPGRLVQMISRPAHWLQPFLNLPVSSDLFPLAGRYFYYDLSRAETELGLAPRRPVQEALAEAYAWFQQAD